MKTFILSRLLIIILVSLIQGCETESKCDKQFCRNGVLVFDACNRRAETKTIIIVDDNNEAIRCQTKN